MSDTSPVPIGFLAATDKTWDESFMKEKVRKVFTEVFLGLGNRDMSKAAQYMFPEELKQFSDKVISMKKDKIEMEFRNFCVRKVDIVWVNNKNDNNLDEFVARILAHAQRIEHKNGKVTHKEAYVTPFEEYWTFQRLNGEWTLKEAHPAFSANDIITRENVDEESTPEQMKWYYTKDRA